MSEDDIHTKGDGWIVTQTGTCFILNYLAGHFATTEKFVEIGEAEATLLKTGGVDFDKFIVAKGLE